jgi:hypothetical protein
MDFVVGKAEVSIAYEIVRRNRGWEEKLVERMLLWKDFYEAFVPGDAGFRSIPQLVFVCEDQKHMAEVFKVLFVNKALLPSIKFYYTTDLDQNEETLDKSLYEFVSDGTQFKINNVSAKFLG